MKNILAKLHAIMEEADYIQKDKRNAAQSYNYASEAAIKERLHGLLVKHKVLFTISCTGQTVEARTTAKGGDSNLTLARFGYAFHDVDTGEKLEGSFEAQGSDGQGKGIYKAITGAIKYILTSTFLIPTGDDPEDDDGNTAAGKVVPNDQKAVPYQDFKYSKPLPNSIPSKGGTQKQCQAPDCGKMYSPKPGTEAFSTVCMDCYKQIKNGQKPPVTAFALPVIEVPTSDIPF